MPYQKYKPLPHSEKTEMPPARLHQAKEATTPTPFFQPKTAGPQVKDAAEGEADRVAKAVQRGDMAPEIAASPPTQGSAQLMATEEEVQSKAQEEEPVQRMGEEEETVQAKQQEEEPVQRMGEEEEVQAKGKEEELQPKRKATSNPPTSFSRGVRQARGGGQQMDASTRTQMEQSIGADFSQVRIHTGSQSEQLNEQINAKAFTTGKDIFFNKGQYQPTAKSGQHLLAHELTHVVQQKAAQQEDTKQRKPKDNQ